MTKLKHPDWRDFLSPEDARIVVRLEKQAQELDRKRQEVSMALYPIRNRGYQRARAAKGMVGVRKKI